MDEYKDDDASRGGRGDLIPSERFNFQSFTMLMQCCWG